MQASTKHANDQTLGCPPTKNKKTLMLPQRASTTISSFGPNNNKRSNGMTC